MSFERQPYPKPHSPLLEVGDVPFTYEDIDEAKEFIRELYEKGERPVVTVKKRYAEALSKGLLPHQTWDPFDGKILVGTFGREPLLLEDEERVSLRINKIDLRQILPRAGGSDDAFHGIVEIRGPVPPENLEIK